MNWFHLANLDSIFDQAGEFEVLKSLRHIKNMTIQTQRGARDMLGKLKDNYQDSPDLSGLFDKAMFYCPDSPKKVKILTDEIIRNIASKLVKNKKNKENKETKVVKGLVRD